MLHQSSTSEIYIKKLLQANAFVVVVVVVPLSLDRMAAQQEAPSFENHSSYHDLTV